MAWPTLLPAWLGSEAVWFLVLNVVVAAIAALSSRRARPSSASPRCGGAVTRRASSVLLQRLRSFTAFSYPSGSAGLSATTTAFRQPDPADAAAQETTDEPAVTPGATPSPPRTLVLTTPHAPAADDEEDEDEDPNAMSMEDAYALVVASRRRPEREREEEARRSDVDAKAEEFIRTFKEDLRQQRLNSIFNYTQMLKQRALCAGRRHQPGDH
ncbi:hypothetical protein U9M48_014224 [Paspalum notatum var. saurae]|uniref:DUF4408 domain-containing protein n=1 Tax=Paspalum notatum var. saurae TaxID=547442 RepID=A0AAQ3T3W1_PASNO